MLKNVRIACRSSASTPPGPLERRRSVPPCAQLQRPLRPPYTPARPESQHCSGASPDASQRRGAPHLAKRVEGTVGCQRRCCCVKSRGECVSPGAAASARATALCVVPGRTTALQRVARSRKRGAPGPSPSAIGPDSHRALRGERKSRVPCRSNRTGACPASNRAEPRCDEAQSRVVRIEFDWRAPRGLRPANNDVRPSRARNRRSFKSIRWGLKRAERAEILRGRIGSRESDGSRQAGESNHRVDGVESNNRVKTCRKIDRSVKIELTE
ncbi:hypothetical protein C8R43DRAFT_638108 [Mycena crocata]|nr:hypothetical protein C8R43DRAFT_638108 [Mycena crocata]